MTFVPTGFYLPTLTTVDDPSLKVIEVDNGISWTLKFYVGFDLIDCINLEYFRPTMTIHPDVLRLPVYWEDEGHYSVKYTVKQCLIEAMSVVCDDYKIL